MTAGQRATRIACGLGLLVTIDAARTRAGCTSVEDQARFQRAVRDTLVCAARRLRSPEQTDCVAAVPPACGVVELDQIVELVGGMPASFPAMPDQARCQVASYRGVRRYLARRIRERRRGIRSQRLSGRAIRLHKHCAIAAVDTPSGPLPRFGGRCSTAGNGPAAVLPTTRLERCLRPAMENIVNRLLEIPAVAPNVVVIVTDDQNYEGIELMPNVQELARQGVRFTKAFTTTPICGPARAGLLTGQHPSRHGVLSNVWEPSPGTVAWAAAELEGRSTLATWFQSAGYRTAHIGKYLNGYFTRSPFIPKGWDDWRVFVDDNGNFFGYQLNDNGIVRSFGSGPDDYSTDVLSTMVLDFLTEHASTPFLLMFTPYAPHAPSLPAPRHKGTLASLDRWRPPSWDEDISDKANWLRFFAFPPEDLLANDANVTNERESLLAVDEAAAEISARLEDLGLTDNTVVVFTSDHGFLRGEHRWIGKQVPYQEAIAIPLTIRYPLRYEAGTTYDGIALNIDIAPTLARLAGIHPDHAIDGRSLTDLIDGADDWRKDFFAQHFIGGFIVPPWDLYSDGRYKYVRNPDDIDELYDLVADPFELTNIAQLAENRELLQNLSAKLDRMLAP